MMFPCSLSEVEEKCKPGHTRYAGVLLSSDGGKTWTWSEPIGALPWSKIGEKPAEFGGELVTIWEPMLFEQADGKIGLLIRNSTAQDNPERAEKPHRMLLYATSSDHGRTWTKARTVEVDTICSRNYAVSGVGTRDSLLMVMNDNHVRVPERISHDRYFLVALLLAGLRPRLAAARPGHSAAGRHGVLPERVCGQRQTLRRLHVPGRHPQQRHRAAAGFHPPVPAAARGSLRTEDRKWHRALRPAPIEPRPRC